MTAIATHRTSHGIASTVDAAETERQLAEDIFDIAGVTKVTVTIRANVAAAIIRTADGGRHAVAHIRADGGTDAEAADILWLKASARLLGTGPS